MNALTEKRYLTLPEPSAGDTLAARERLLAALPEGCRLRLGCMQQLYPVLHEAGYRVTVTLCPGAGGTDVASVFPESRSTSSICIVVLPISRQRP